MSADIFCGGLRQLIIFYTVFSRVTYVEATLNMLASCMKDVTRMDEYWQVVVNVY